MEKIEKVMSFLESVDSDLDYLIEYLEEDDDFFLLDEMEELSEHIIRIMRRVDRINDVYGDVYD